tara:strand:+ start:10809 stop:11036 length:228 start_codon:yes stop_codon:yes gene_type:complete
MTIPKNVDNSLKDIMAIPSHNQHTQLTELRKTELKLKLLVATLNVIRLEIKDKEPEFAGIIERSFAVCGINIDDE